jgi:hypothetical protein
MSLPPVPPGSEGSAELLTKMAAAGCIRTRRDAETFRDYMRQGGYDKGGYVTLYRAVLALLGDLSALATLEDPQHTVAMKAYRGMKAHYIGDSECRCLRTATGGVARAMTTCPVHGETPGAQKGMRNLTGLIP